MTALQLLPALMAALDTSMTPAPWRCDWETEYSGDGRFIDTNGMLSYEYPDDVDGAAALRNMLTPLRDIVADWQRLVENTGHPGNDAHREAMARAACEAIRAARPELYARVVEEEQK